MCSPDTHNCGNVQGEGSLLNRDRIDRMSRLLRDGLHGQNRELWDHRSWVLQNLSILNHLTWDQETLVLQDQRIQDQQT